jgi:hypothetical protein
MGNSAINKINLGVPAFIKNFVAGDPDLAAGILTVNHNLGNQFNSAIVYDENDIQIIPDDVTATGLNTTTVDLTSYTVHASNPWRCVILDTGANINNISTDLNISGQTTGDLLYFNGSNWVRFAPGTSGQVLTSNGAASLPTYQAGGSSFVGFSAYRAGGNWIVPDNNFNTIGFGHEHFDIGSNYNTGTYQFTAPQTGYYHFTIQCYWAFIPSNAGALTLRLTTTTHTHWTVFYMNEIGGGITGQQTRWGQGIAKTLFMTSGDTCSADFQMITGTTGTMGLDDGLSTATGSFFTGYLIGT